MSLAIRVYVLCRSVIFVNIGGSTLRTQFSNGNQNNNKRYLIEDKHCSRGEKHWKVHRSKNKYPTTNSVLHQLISKQVRNVHFELFLFILQTLTSIELNLVLLFNFANFKCHFQIFKFHLLTAIFTRQNSNFTESEKIKNENKIIKTVCIFISKQQQIKPS